MSLCMPGWQGHIIWLAGIGDMHVLNSKIKLSQSMSKWCNTTFENVRTTITDLMILHISNIKTSIVLYPSSQWNLTLLEYNFSRYFSPLSEHSGVSPIISGSRRTVCVARWTQPSRSSCRGNWVTPPAATLWPALAVPRVAPPLPLARQQNRKPVVCAQWAQSVANSYIGKSYGLMCAPPSLHGFESWDHLGLFGQQWWMQFF